MVNLKRRDQQKGSESRTPGEGSKLEMDSLLAKEVKEFRLVKRQEQNVQWILPQYTGRTNPTNSRTSVFWPPELKENKFLFKPPRPRSCVLRELGNESASLLEPTLGGPISQSPSEFILVVILTEVKHHENIPVGMPRGLAPERLKEGRRTTMNVGCVFDPIKLRKINNVRTHISSSAS